MTNGAIEVLWQPPHREDNSQVLRARHPGLFRLIGDLDAFGHRLAHRAPNLLGRIDDIDRLVGLAYLRRLSTLFAGARNLFENAAVEAAKIIVRAHFELFLHVQLLVYGGKRPVTPLLATTHLGRERRARYYYVAGLRDRIYQGQALLDGAWGGRRSSGVRAARLRAEVQRDHDRLLRRFPAQMRTLGQLRCFAPPNQRRYYYDHLRWYFHCFERRSNVNSVRSLARRLGHGKDYYLCYSLLSGLVHPIGIHRDLELGQQGAAMFSPYMVEAFPLLAFWTCTWYAQSAWYLARAYMPEVQDDAMGILQQTTEALEEVEIDVPLGYAG